MSISKKNWKKIFLFTFPIFCFALIGTVVYADVQLKQESSLLSDQYSLDTYKSYMDSNTGFWGFVTGDSATNIFHSIVNGIFSFIKTVWGVVDRALDLMFSADPLEEVTETVTDMTNALWDIISDNYLPTLVVIALVMIAFTFVTKSSQLAIKQLAKLFFVLFLSMMWFSNGEEILNQFNDFSSDLQADIMSSANNTDFMNDVKIDNGEVDDNVTILRNMYFDQAVKKPYYLLNYGTAKESEIEKNDDFGKPDDFLAEDASEDSASEIEEKYEEQVDSEGYHNVYLTADKIDYKMSVVIFSLISLFLYSIPLFVIAFLNFLLQMGALLMYYALPLLSMISILPQYSNAIINGVVKVLQLLLMKAVLGLGILIVSLLTLIVDTLFEPTNQFMFLLNMVIKGITMIVAWKYREKIIKVITNGLVQAQMKTPKVVNEGMQKAQDKVSDVFSNGRKSKPDDESADEDSSQSVSESSGNVAYAVDSGGSPDFQQERSEQRFQSNDSDERVSDDRMLQNVDDQEMEDRAVEDESSVADNRTEQTDEFTDENGNVAVASVGNDELDDVPEEDFDREVQDDDVHYYDSADEPTDEDLERTEQQVAIDPVLDDSKLDDEMLSDDDLDRVDQEVGLNMATEQEVESSMEDLDNEIPDFVEREQEVHVDQEVTGQKEVRFDENDIDNDLERDVQIDQEEAVDDEDE